MAHARRRRRAAIARSASTARKKCAAWPRSYGIAELHIAQRGDGVAALEREIEPTGGSGRRRAQVDKRNDCLGRGDAGVTLGAIANVLHSPGREKDLGQVGRVDEVGRKLQDAALPARVQRRGAPSREAGF